VHLQFTPINYAQKFFSAVEGARAPSAPPGYAYEITHFVCLHLHILKRVFNIFLISLFTSGRAKLVYA